MGMTTETVPGRVNVGEFDGKAFLLNLDRAERAEFYKLLEEAPWEGKTASGHWQVRDLCGHLIDVTEGYLDRFALARAATAPPGPLGPGQSGRDRKSTRLNSSHANISYAVFRLKKKKEKKIQMSPRRTRW